MTRVVIAEIPENAGRDTGFEQAIFGDGVDVVHYAHEGDKARLVAACKDADAILTDYVPFDKETLSALRRCRLISVAASGYNNIDIAAAAEAGISVSAIDEYCTDEVADHTILLMLAICRRLQEYHRQVQTEHRWQFDSLIGLRRMSELTLGIVGFGKIGQAVARRAAAFGMNICAYDPYADEAVAAHHNVTLCELGELYSTADVVSLHCGLTSDNAHLIDRTALNAMIRKPVLINCARGGLVDENALLAALDSGQISGAGLDVLSNESPDLASSMFVGRDNVILTPHVAFYSDASMLENRRISAGNIREFLDGNYSGVRKFIHDATGGTGES